MFLEVVTIVLISVALAMDAFAISITLGMSGLAKHVTERLKIGLTFGFFQSGLFLLGCLTLSLFGSKLTSYNSVIAGVLLALLGIKMLKDSFTKVKEKCPHQECFHCKKNQCLNTGEYRFLTTKILLIYGTATAIDAFAAGVSYSLVNDHILWAALSIGLVTYLFSYFGSAFGMYLKHYIGNKATIIGGIILLLLAVKSFI